MRHQYDDDMNWIGHGDEPMESDLYDHEDTNCKNCGGDEDVEDVGIFQRERWIVTGKQKRI